eukprot:3485659-Rhodomonas_salina.1
MPKFSVSGLQQPQAPDFQAMQTHAGSADEHGHLLLPRTLDVRVTKPKLCQHARAPERFRANRV